MTEPNAESVAGVKHDPGGVYGDVVCPECGYTEEGPHLGAVLCPMHSELVVMEEVDG